MIGVGCHWMSCWEFDYQSETQTQDWPLVLGLRSYHCRFIISKGISTYLPFCTLTHSPAQKVHTTLHLPGFRLSFQNKALLGSKEWISLTTRLWKDRRTERKEKGERRREERSKKEKRREKQAGLHFVSIYYAPHSMLWMFTHCRHLTDVLWDVLLFS